MGNHERGHIPAVTAIYPGGLLTASLSNARFLGDIERLEDIQKDPELKSQLQRTEILRKKSLLRTRLLSDAVRVNSRLTPNLAESVQRLGRQLESDKPLEAYVFADPAVNAFVTEGSKRFILAVSSGAVNLLSSAELEFILGHEMGHLAFGHLDVPVELVVEMGQVRPDQLRLLRSWQRAAEISADRAGLQLCQSLEVAAGALFKTLSGLSLPGGVGVDPREFASQWEGLAEEVLDYGGSEHWQLGHPFPPLRMQAMTLFFEQGQAAEPAIARMLALMEDSGTARAGGAVQGDPLLARFHFWGGLFVALADGPPNPKERDLLHTLAPPGTPFEEVLRDSASEACLERFQEAFRTRQTKLNSAELHRIMQGLIRTAAVDGPLNQKERDSLYRLGETLGLRPDAFNLAIAKAQGGEN